MAPAQIGSPFSSMLQLKLAARTRRRQIGAGAGIFMHELSKGDAPEFRTQEDFEAWLKDKPRDWSVVLAARAALRVLPLLAWAWPPKVIDGNPEQFPVLIGNVFRCAAIARVTAKFPTRQATTSTDTSFAHSVPDLIATDHRIMELPDVVIARGAKSAARAISLATIASRRTGASAARAAAVAVDFAAATSFLLAVDFFSNSAIELTAIEVEVINSTAIDLALNHTWEPVSRDAARLSARISPSALAADPLWSLSLGAPDGVKRAWNQLCSTLPTGEHWEVWIDWYLARLKTSRWSERKELIYASVPLEVWEQGHVAANTWIYEELQELKRKKPQRDNKPLNDHDLIEQSPAPTSFRIVGDKIDAAPETTASIDETIAAAFYDEAKRKARELRERLERAQADKRLQTNLALLEARLGASLADVSVGHLLPSLYSLERDFNVYNSEEGRKEHSLELIAALGDAAGAVRDFVSLFPKVRLIEAEALALRIVQQPEMQEDIAEQGRKAIAAATESPLVTSAAASALQDTHKSVTIARDADERAHQLSYLVLDLRNFARANITLALKGLGGLAGDCWADIRKKVPPTVGTLTRISLITFGLATLVDQLAPAKIKLLKEVGGVARDLGKAIEDAAPPKASETTTASSQSERKPRPQQESRAASNARQSTRGAGPKQ